MKIYFDTEFTGLKKDTTLVSIGLITEKGESFYAELTDYDKTYRDPWFIENVENNLLLKYTTKRTDIADMVVRGTKNEVSYELYRWLKHFVSIQLVSDVCHYDMVLFIDLFGGAFDLLPSINPCCHDINQDLARICKITEREAFDLNREKFLTENNVSLPKGDKHNSLYDAKVIQLIDQTLHRNIHQEIKNIIDGLKNSSMKNFHVETKGE